MSCSLASNSRAGRTRHSSPSVSRASALAPWYRTEIEQRPFLDNCYPQVAKAGGNPTAKEVLARVMDVTDVGNMEPIAAWDRPETAGPWIGQPGARFGAQFLDLLLTSLLIFGLTR